MSTVFITMKRFLLILLFIPFSLAAQDDCPEALPACALPYPSTPSGYGMQELDSLNRGCLTGDETNSTWFSIKVEQDGSLEMLIDGQGNTNFDFAIWGPNADCSSLAAWLRQA
jgi:hypothetical protein